MPCRYVLYCCWLAAALAPSFLSCYLLPNHPFFSNTQEMKDERRVHTTEDDIVLVVRYPTLASSQCYATFI